LGTALQMDVIIQRRVPSLRACSDRPYSQCRLLVV